MTTTELINYSRIAEAIDYIRKNFRSQPGLDEIAKNANLSPFHFQRLFTDWAGVSPKKFLQYISVQHAKQMLKNRQTTLFEAAIDSGLSGTGRLHDLFVSIEGMTPGEFKNGGAELDINYSFANSPFGEILAASTSKGLCYLAFSDKQVVALGELRKIYPKAALRNNKEMIHENAVKFFNHDWTALETIKLHLKGTPFQLKVWETLLKIPSGNLSSYGSIAEQIAQPNASRAVGTAIGSNPVAFLIPCHRVIQAGGELGGYMWGLSRKAAIIGWEAARRETHGTF